MLGILLVGVSPATRVGAGAEADRKDRVRHAGPVQGLFPGVIIKVISGVLDCIIELEVQGEGVEDHVCLLDRDASVHAGILVDDTRFSISIQEYVFCLSIPLLALRYAENVSKEISIQQSISDQCLCKATVGD